MNENTETPVEKKRIKINHELINEEITAVWIDKGLNFLKKDSIIELFNKNEEIFTKIGLYGIYLMAVIGLLTSLVFPIRYDALPFGKSLLAGLLWVITCIIIHYTAFKFIPAVREIIKSTPTQMGSEAFLNSSALLFGLSGVVSLCAGIFFWIKTSSMNTFLFGLSSFLVCLFMLVLTLNPSLLNIKITEQTSPGEEFIALFSFFIKSFLKLIPVTFGLGVILAVLNLLSTLFSSYGYINEIFAKLISIAGFSSVALLPIIGYVVFLIYYFTIDIASAILSLPAKLDSLKK